MLTYRDSGVDVDAGNQLVQKIRALNPEIGGFSGLFPLGDQYLVSGADGVGTKLKLAFDLNRHDSIGQDLVAMSINDIIVTGAKPLFFLDYFATSKLNVDQAAEVIAGIARACELASCKLLGGETAEMPGFYGEGEYDLSGFAVGIVDKKDLIDGSSVKTGDVLLGIPSTGLHSNGFSLVHRILEESKLSLDTQLPEFKQNLGLELLTPTAIYVEAIKSLKAVCTPKAFIHVTGGGYYENIPRLLPKGLGCELNLSAWTPPPIFQLLQKEGNVAREEMYRTFNMGLGMLCILDPEDVSTAEDEGWLAIGTINNSAKVSLC